VPGSRTPPTLPAYHRLAVSGACIVLAAVTAWLGCEALCYDEDGDLVQCRRGNDDDSNGDEEAAVEACLDYYREVVHCFDAAGYDVDEGLDPEELCVEGASPAMTDSFECAADVLDDADCPDEDAAGEAIQEAGECFE